MAPILDRELFSRPPTRRRGELLSWIAAAFVAVPLAFLIVGGIFAAHANMTATESRVASVSARAHLAAAQEGKRIPVRNLAAAATPSFLDFAAGAVYRTLCPLFGTCNIAENPSANHATSFLNVKLPYSSSGARDGAPAATSVAASNEIPDRATAAAASYSETNPENVKSPEFIPPSPPNGGLAAMTTLAASYESDASLPRPAPQPLAAATPDQHSLAVLGVALQKLFDQKLAALDLSLRQVIFQNVSAPLSLPASGGVVNNIALSQKIDSLAGTSLSNISVNGVSGLTDADIPDSITASNYLPLTGGALTGDLAMTGTLTAGALSVTAVFSGGAVIAPYFTATSTSATSSFPYASTTAISASDIGYFGTASTTNLTVSSLTSGRVPYVAAAGAFADSSSFLFDPSLLRLTATNASTTALTVSGSASFPGSGVWTSTGNVGIGTTNPAQKLQVGATTDAASNLIRITTGAGTNANPVLSLFRSGSSEGFITYINDGQNKTLFGNDSAGYTTSALIAAAKLVINNTTGNVGIGTTQPVTKLHLQSSTDYTSGLLFSPRTDGQVGLSLWYDNTGTTNSYIDSRYNDNNAAMQFRMKTNGAPVAAMTILGNGNVGIGTTTPWGRLSVTDASDANQHLTALRASAGDWQVSLNYASDARVLFTNNAYSGFGTSYAASNGNPGIRLGNGGSYAYIVGGSGNLLLNPVAGNVGISTTTPWRKLSVTGTVGFDGLTAGAGAGALCLSANKEVTYSAGAGCTGSSQRFKHDISSLDASTSLDEVLQLNPVSFVYNDDIGVKGPQVGLIAEQVQQVDPRLVATEASGTPFTVKYENLTAILAGAIQQLADKLDDLATTVASFADHFTTRELTFTRATGQQLCLSDAPNDPSPVCVTKSQLAALLSQSAAAGFANPTPAPTDNQFANPTPDPAEPPIVEIQGNNPAHINIGDSYNDLGARITGPTQADTNLGIKTFLNGALVSNIVLDTSLPATDTIDYVATNAAGTSTSTRTIIIAAPQDQTPPPEPATGEPAPAQQ